MINAKHVALVLAGILVGCGAAAVAPIARSWAQPAGGDWRCYSNREFPNLADATSSNDARRLTMAMNQVARHAPSGTVFSTVVDSAMAGYVCVKY